MASTPIQIDFLPSGLTGLVLKLFPAAGAGWDTQANADAPLTAGTNNRTSYRATVAEALTGDFKAEIVNSGGVPVGTGIVIGLEDTTTVQFVRDDRYKLASDGLDGISTTAPSGAFSTWNFRERMVMLCRRLFGKTTLNATHLKTYGEDGASVIATQPVSDDGTTQTQGEAS